MDAPSIQNAKSYLDFNGLAQLKGQAQQNAGSALRETSQQFEAMMLQEMLKSMRQTIDKSELTSNAATDTFESMFDKEVAVKMAQRGATGLADMLVSQIQKQQTPPAAQTSLSNGLDATQPMALNPPAKGLPLMTPSSPAGMVLRTPQTLPLNLPPNPLAGEP